MQHRKACPLWAGWLLGAALAAGSLALAPVAAAYPDRPIRLVVPYGPGGAGDIIARAVTQRMGIAMGQSFIIENRPGAGGVVATEAVAHAPPDGYTLLLMNNGHAISAALFRQLPYDATTDFDPITTISNVSMVMLVPQESSLRSVADFVNASKASPEMVNLGSVNIGSTPHLAAELFKSMANPGQTIVPFNATSAVVAGLRGGQIQAAFEFITPVLGQIRGGALRALAVTTRTRTAVLPDIPTLDESGVAGYEAASWNGLAAPRGTPADIIDRLNREVRAAVETPEVKAKLESLGAEPRVMTPTAMRQLLADEIVKWNAVIDQAHIPRQ